MNENLLNYLGYKGFLLIFSLSFFRIEVKKGESRAQHDRIFSTLD